MNRALAVAAVVVAVVIGASALGARTAGARPSRTAAAARGRKGVAAKVELRATHLRIGTRRGPIHLFRPAGYDRRTAGIVVYVHGHFIHADRAWREHDLPAQFIASGRNALFIVPEAPASTQERPSWSNLARLITTAVGRAHMREPPGPLVIMGHSGAYKTMVPWLAHPRLRHVILVDALYGNEPDFRAWLDKSSARQMTLVVRGTGKWADPFVRALPYALTLPQIPGSIDDLTPEERAAKLLHLRSQYGHFELITGGKTLPLLLQRTPLPPTKSLPTRSSRR
ncbi:MAG: hypothetical protein ABUL67_03975 [Haliangium ochraceum]